MNKRNKVVFIHNKILHIKSVVIRNTALYGGALGS